MPKATRQLSGRSATNVALGEVVEIITQYWDRDTAVPERLVAGEHIDEGDLRVRRWGMTDDDLVPPTFNRWFQSGDVLLHSRNIKKIARPDFRGITGEKLFILRSKSESVLLQELLPFILQSVTFQTYAESRWAGSTNKFLNKGPLEEFEFALPPIEEQDRLARALRSLDEGCEALRALSGRSRDLLASAATALLQQRNLLDLSAASPPPAPGWRNVSFSEVCDHITYGFTNPMPTADAGPWLVTAKDVVDGHIDYTTARHTTRDAFENALTEKSRVRIGDVLLTKDGTLGRVAVVDCEDVCINQSVAVLRPIAELRGAFLARIVRAPQMQARLMKDSSGSAVKHLYITKIAKTRFFLPPKDAQQRISVLLDSVEERIRACAMRVLEIQRFKKSILEGAFRHAL
jgi:type I restriction enzyme S subunit